MDTSRKCGCKGIRTCIICENQGKSRNVTQHDSSSAVRTYTFCAKCNKAWKDLDETGENNKLYGISGTSTDTYGARQNGSDLECQHTGLCMEFSGIEIIHDFVSGEEEEEICTTIDKTPFVLSQSGRRKQDYGPKVNFKKQKLKMSGFTGLPKFSQELYERMTKLDSLTNFQPVELCNLEYSSERGSSIDPHFDDFWLWGERLVTLNLLSDSILCFTNDDKPEIEVHVPMLRRSLLIVYGPARHVWKHAIHRQNIQDRRIAITLRELSKEFQTGGKREEEGDELLKIALSFNGDAVGSHKI